MERGCGTFRTRNKGIDKPALCGKEIAQSDCFLDIAIYQSCSNRESLLQKQINSILRKANCKKPPAGFNNYQSKGESMEIGTGAPQPKMHFIELPERGTLPPTSELILHLE